MARLLAIDWDYDRFHIIAVATSRRGVAVEKSIVWAPGEDLTAAGGEALGRKLREALRAAGIPPAPVVACLGRERVVIKELRYPPIPAAEEPALVRFQAAKELSELPDDVVIDYAGLSAPDHPGERQALAVALKRSLANAWLALCRGLGVKLLALTPRPHALLGAVARAQAEGRAPSGETFAVLALGERWAELSILHLGRVLFARSLAPGAGLAGELKRSLSVFTTTSVAVHPPVALLVTGRADPELESRLREQLGLPVERLDPLAGEELVPVSERGTLAAAVGAAHQWARSGALPINFASPKQPIVTSGPGKRRLAVWGAAAALVVIVLIVGASIMLSRARTEIEQLTKAKIDADDLYKKMAQERLDVEALKDWEDTTIPWLDEIYDLAARFPHQVGLRVKDFTAGPITKRNAKDKFVAHIAINGVARTDQTKLVHQFIDAVNASKPYLRAGAPVQESSGPINQEFQIKIDLAKRPTDGYSTRLTVPPRGAVEPAAEAGVDAEEPIDGEKGGGR